MFSYSYILYKFTKIYYTLPKEVCLPRRDPIDIFIYCSLLIIKRRHSYKICGDIKFYIFLNNTFYYNIFYSSCVIIPTLQKNNVI